MLEDALVLCAGNTSLGCRQVGFLRDSVWHMWRPGMSQKHVDLLCTMCLLVQAPLADALLLETGGISSSCLCLLHCRNLCQTLI